MRALAAVVTVGFAMGGSAFADTVHVVSSSLSAANRANGAPLGRGQEDAWRLLATWTPAPELGAPSGEITGDSRLSGLPAGSGTPSSNISGDAAGFPGASLSGIQLIGGGPDVGLSHFDSVVHNGHSADYGGATSNSDPNAFVAPLSNVDVSDGMLHEQSIAVVPVPQGVLLGLAGLGGVGVAGWVRRRNR